MNKMMDKEKNALTLRHWLLVACLFSFGLILIILSITNPSGFWQKLSGEIGFFLISGVIVHLIYDKIIRTQESNFIYEKWNEIIYGKESGITGSYPTFPLGDFQQDVRSGKKHLWILQSWIENISQVEKEIEDALKKNMMVEILVLNPNSEYAKAREKDLPLKEATGLVSLKIHNNLRAFAELYRKLNKPKNFAVKVYDCTAIFDIYAVDDTIYLGLFWRNIHSTSAPHLRLRIKGDAFFFSHHVYEHYKSISESSTTKTLNFESPALDDQLKLT